MRLRERQKSGSIRQAKEQSSTVLAYHRQGPGKRFVFFDAQHTPGAQLYAIVRTVARLRRPPEPYVEEHTHRVPSYYLFMGRKKNLSGLEAEVTIGGARKTVRSPCGVFIPAGTPHHVRVVRGSGQFVHILLEEDFHRSLREPRTSRRRRLVGSATARRERPAPR